MITSTALRTVIAGPSRRGCILGTSRHAWWVAVGEDVLVVANRSAVRLPNAIVVDALPPVATIEVGGGTARIAGRRLAISRWWDPRPTLAPTTPDEVRTRLDGWAQRSGQPPTGADLGAALTRCDADVALEVIEGLLGRGPGLTPSGDDLLAGAFAAFRHVGRALGDSTAAHFVDVVRAPLLDLARHRTTSLSYSLIAHALAGEVALPVAGLLRGIAGRGSIDDAVHVLLSVGHSSGSALAEGVLVGAFAACGAAA